MIVLEAMVLSLTLSGHVDWSWSATSEALVADDQSPAAVLHEGVHLSHVGEGLVLPGHATAWTVADTLTSLPDPLPHEALTLEGWVSIDMPRQWGGIISAVQDNGRAEAGWVLGYDASAFTFGLAGTNADDPDGDMTYITAGSPYELGRWHHVVGTYDGTIMRLYVDGRLEAQSEAQQGPIFYDDTAPLAIGGYLDANENHGHDGRIHAVRVRDGAMSHRTIAAASRLGDHLRTQKPWVDTPFEWSVAPFLTWPTTEAVSVTAETMRPSSMQVDVRSEDGAWSRTWSSQEPEVLHTFRLDGLEPHAKYFYRVTATDDEESLDSGQLTFRTAADRGDAFSFVAIGDTQAQPEVVARVAELSFETRPNLLIHAGDLVTTGSDKSHWTGHFFPNMKPLIEHVPMMPVLGNHEQDAQHYYDYMDLPAPEKWYSFSYGDADFFMIDGNRSLAEQSEQLAWLDAALEASDATWTFAVLHQPPWTSDSNDYGDTTVGPSARGDMNARNIVDVLERHRVDICFSGHVHDYERTFPILDESIDRWEDGGVIYVTCAGGGGHLEDFDPSNTWFGHRKAKRHHLVYVGIHDGLLEFQAIDEDGRVFDVMTLDKRDATRGVTTP